jgi:hypothetical protein
MNRMKHLQLVNNTTSGVARSGQAWEGDLNGASFQQLARATGAEFKHLALDHIAQVAVAAGVTVNIRRRQRVDVWAVDAIVTMPANIEVIVLVHGCIDTTPTAGLRRVDTTLKALASTYGLVAQQQRSVLIVTSHLPDPGSQSARLVARAGEHLGGRLLDVIATSEDFAGTLRLTRYLTSGVVDADMGAPWRQLSGGQMQLFSGVL